MSEHDTDDEGLYRVLDLFSGLGGFSQAFEDSDRWEVTTVDIKERFDPDVQADVFDLRPSDFDRDFDVVLASPPCTQFSLAASRYERFVDGEPQTSDAADSVSLIYHTIGLIRGLSPDYWFLENPQGHLREVIGDPEATITYCQYGTEYMKPTDLWGDHPPMTYRRCSRGDDCHLSNRNHDKGAWSSMDMAGYERDPAERAKVPYELSKAIRDAIEQQIDSPQPVQAELEEVLA